MRCPGFRPRKAPAVGRCRASATSLVSPRFDQGKTRRGPAYHAQIPIGHVIVDPDPAPGTREQADRRSWGRPVDHHVFARLAGRGHLRDGYPEHMIRRKLAIVDDTAGPDGGEAPAEQEGLDRSTKSHFRCPVMREREGVPSNNECVKTAMHGQKRCC